MLEYEPIPLENSEDELADAKERFQKPRWVFEGFSKLQLTDLFESSGLTSGQKAFFLDASEWEALPGGYAVSPSDEMILGLGKAARQRLFPILARNRANYPQYFSYRFRPDAFEDHFKSSGLPLERIQMLREMAYTNAGAICLAVDESLKSRFRTNEFRALLRAVATIPTVRMRLRVTPEADLDGLLNYWGGARRKNEVRPLLESLAREGSTMNVARFFPTFARQRLYSFPDPEGNPEEAREDCFFTALNFFNSPPDPKFFDESKVRETLQTDYDLVHNRQMLFGDLVALVDTKGRIIHLCVFVADDVVFTKNGGNYLQPWVLMRINDMLPCYASEEPLKMAVFRGKKSLADSRAALSAAHHD